jgi:hypothetical protein
MMLTCLAASVGGGLYLATRSQGHVNGTRAEAHDALYRHVLAFDPPRPAMPVRRTVYEDGEGYLLIIEGRTQTYEYAFKLSRVMFDSAPATAPPPAPAAPPFTG